MPPPDQRPPTKEDLIPHIEDAIRSFLADEQIPGFKVGKLWFRVSVQKDAGSADEADSFSFLVYYAGICVAGGDARSTERKEATGAGGSIENRPTSKTFKDIGWLIVEDNEKYGELLALGIRAKGYSNVELVTSAEKALELLRILPDAHGVLAIRNSITIRIRRIKTFIFPG